MISYVLYYFVRISVRFWNWYSLQFDFYKVLYCLQWDSLKIDFLCFILFREDFSEVLKRRLSKIDFLNVLYFLWRFQWGFENKKILENLIFYVWYYFVRISVRFWKRRPKICFLLFYIILWDFSEVLKKWLSNIWFLMFYIILWGFQWGFEIDTLFNLIFIRFYIVYSETL